MKRDELVPRFTEFIPRELDEGVLYVSITHATAVHLCACGCQTKVVTPLSPEDWQLIFDGTLTLNPSIGNGQFPCRSHYFIRSNRVEWSLPQSLGQARAGLRRDTARREAPKQGRPQPPRSLWSKIRTAFRVHH